MGLLLKSSINISLKRGKHRVYALCALTTGNPRIKKQNALLMIGNGVSVLVTTVTYES
jgi:hypothetical protein